MLVTHAHLEEPQVRTSFNKPHCEPPCADAVITLRDRVCAPPLPHVFVHAPHGPNALSTQSTGAGVGEGVGNCVGDGVGASVGACVGDCVGAVVGACVAGVTSQNAHKKLHSR